MKKRVSALLLSLVLALSLLPFAANAAEQEGLSAYVPVLDEAMRAEGYDGTYGEAMFYELDDQAPREMILVHTPEDAAHAVVEVYTIRDGIAQSILHEPLFVLVGSNFGSVSVGEYDGKPILVTESISTEAGEKTVRTDGGVKRFAMKGDALTQEENAVYSVVTDISSTAAKDPVLYDQSTGMISGKPCSYADYLDWRHSFVLLATNAGFASEDWDDDAVPFDRARAFCASGFRDVPAGAYYANAVRWAAEQEITTGTSADQFSPDGSCTRAQFVTFLWRAKGKPAMSGGSGFSDVSARAYYADAVAWAVSEKVTTGVGNGRFDPDGTLTRAQVVTFLYRLAGAEKPDAPASFADVPAGAYYADAVAWALQTGVTTGKSANAFGPDDNCTRAQAVTFLYRHLK